MIKSKLSFALDLSHLPGLVFPFFRYGPYVADTQ